MDATDALTADEPADRLVHVFHRGAATAHHSYAAASSAEAILSAEGNAAVALQRRLGDTLDCPRRIVGSLPVPPGDYDVVLREAEAETKHQPSRLNARRCASSDNDSFQAAALAAVLFWNPSSSVCPASSHRRNISNGVLVYIPDDAGNNKYYVFTLGHGLCARSDPSTEPVEQRDALLYMLAPHSQVPDIPLTWTRCIHWMKEHSRAQLHLRELEEQPQPNEREAKRQQEDMRYKCIQRSFRHDVAVFELDDAHLGPEVRGRLFNWDGGRQATSTLRGVSLCPDQPDSGLVFSHHRVEERFTTWATHSGYVSAPSAKAQNAGSGTGLTDKQQRVVALLAGHMSIRGSEHLMAVLVTRHQELLRLPKDHSARSEFTPQDSSARQEALRLLQEAQDKQYQLEPETA